MARFPADPVALWTHAARLRSPAVPGLPWRETLGRPVRETLGRPVRRGLKALGYGLVRLSPGPQATAPSALPPDFDPETAAVVEATRPYTLTSPERVFALCSAVRHVVTAKVPGAVVECGVWRGGSMMAAAMTLCSMGCGDRDLYMFDTFETTPAPTGRDVDCWGIPAAVYFENAGAAGTPDSYLPIEEVRALLESTGYPPDRLRFVPGLVEDTVPAEAPGEIAVLRLDTDWYGSTAHEMRHLFPRLAPGGVLIVDDYGHFKGARDAVDEYLAEHDLHILLHRVDYTARMAVVNLDG